MVFRFIDGIDFWFVLKFLWVFDVIIFEDVEVDEDNVWLDELGLKFLRFILFFVFLVINFKLIEFVFFKKDSNLFVVLVLKVLLSI